MKKSEQEPMITDHRKETKINQKDENQESLNNNDTVKSERIRFKHADKIYD